MIQNKTKTIMAIVAIAAAVGMISALSLSALQLAFADKDNTKNDQDAVVVKDKSGSCDLHVTVTPSHNDIQHQKC